MRTKRLFGLAVCLILVVAGCTNWQWTWSRKNSEPVPSDIRPTRIEYVDSDAFDAVMESSLVNRDPIIVIQTRNDKPDWEDRLNAWIAAWNRGSRSTNAAKVRFQSPLGPNVKVDGETIREFRLLVNGLMDRIEDNARRGSNWWMEERTRNRRVNLLKPYSLRFHMNDEGLIQLILFHGDYAQQYQSFVRGLRIEEGDIGWSRGFVCSRCAAAKVEGKLVSQPTPDDDR